MNDEQFKKYKHEIATQEYNNDYWLVDNLFNGKFDKANLGN